MCIRDRYNTYQNLYTSALLTGSSRVSEYRENRNKFRKAKEFAWLYLVLGHVLTTIDAYVDRHLMEFDISTDLTYIVPGNSPVMSLAFSFPIAIQNSHLKKKNRTITLYWSGFNNSEILTLLFLWLALKKASYFDEARYLGLFFNSLYLRSSFSALWLWS